MAAATFLLIIEPSQRMYRMLRGLFYSELDMGDPNDFLLYPVVGLSGKKTEVGIIALKTCHNDVRHPLLSGLA